MQLLFSFRMANSRPEAAQVPRPAPAASLENPLIGKLQTRETPSAVLEVRKALSPMTGNIL